MKKTLEMQYINSILLLRSYISRSRFFLQKNADYVLI